MAIYSIGKERESLTCTSESYKAIVRKYLESMGYSQLTDSYVEGHLTDMIFVNPNISLEKQTHVETKATTISLSDENLSLELMNYLIEWLKKPDNKRFDLFIFALKLANKKEFQKIFGSQYSTKSLKDWFNKYKKKLPKEKSDSLGQHKFKDIVAFVSHVIIYEGDETRLTNALEEKNKHSNLSLQAYAQNLLKDVQRRGNPIRKKNKLISNLVPLSIPNEYYAATVKYKKLDSFYEHFNKKNVELPPLKFYTEEQKIYTFDDLKSRNLNGAIKGEIIGIKITKESHPQFIVSLINNHLRRIFWKKGLRRVPKSNIYFFEGTKVDDVFQTRKCKSGAKGEEKEITIPYYKEENGEKKLNFLFHHAAEISSKVFWDKYYIEIIPRRMYSLDGVTPIEGELKDAIDRTFRNPLFNRASNKLSEIRFWSFYLFKSQDYEKGTEEWFKKFQFGELETVDFDWVPQTVPLGQTVLGEYDE